MENETILIGLSFALGAGCFILPIVAAINGKKDLEKTKEKYEDKLSKLRKEVDDSDYRRTVAVNEVMEIGRNIDAQRNHYEERLKRLTDKIDELSKYKPKRGKGGRFVAKN